MSESNLPNYYYAHERAYQGIRQKGGIGWGNVQRIEHFRDPDTESFLQRTIPLFFKEINGLDALDVGCGSGPTAHTLYDFGFSVLGIDVSTTAIEMAREMAGKLEKKIQFQAADLLEVSKRPQRYDLVYDSHCFHCIVSEKDRAQAFQSVAKLLKLNGLFILDTSVFRSDVDITGGVPTLKFDSDYILWHQTNKNNFEGIVEEDGVFWCPQRRFYPVEKVKEELAEAGFEIVHQDWHNQTEELHTFRAVCRKRI